MKHNNKISIWTGVLLLISVLAIAFTAPVQKYLGIPNQAAAIENNSASEGTPASVNNDPSVFYAEKPGNSQLFHKVAGLPSKKVNKDEFEVTQIIPGGQSIGVQLHTLGVLVVGHHQVDGKNGKMSPGEEANIQVGDVILEIDGNKIKEMEDIKSYVAKAGKKNKKLDITIKRGEETIKTTLDPVEDSQQNKYRIGLYIRDSAAGIGTMTFYEPKSKKYGALGHVISDMDTQKPIEIHDGSIVKSNVTSIEKGNNGTPGEKQAKFSIDDDKIGSINKNSPFGVFGNLNKSLSNGKYDKPMPIALSHEVKEGPAKILTVIDGNEVEEFEVEVVSSVSQKFPAKKGMIIQITDPELLKKTGGIVQGMSGSPIIQNGKIIGAVTHVFVNDPTSGYGVHIEWMLQETGIGIKKKQEKAS